MIIYVDYFIRFVGFMVIATGALALTIWLMLRMFIFTWDTLRKFGIGVDIWKLGWAAKVEKVQKERNRYPG